MVFDVESIGLHGEGYAVGYVVIVDGKEVEADMFACPGSMAEGVDSDRLWVYGNIPAPAIQHQAEPRAKQAMISKTDMKPVGSITA